jgi:hypothetical protein
MIPAVRRYVLAPTPHTVVSQQFHFYVDFTILKSNLKYGYISKNEKWMSNFQFKKAKHMETLLFYGILAPLGGATNAIP